MGNKINMSSSLKSLSYKEAQKIISSKIDKEDKKLIKGICREFEITERTVYNYYNLDEQSVSDKLFTKISSFIGIDIRVVWEKGIRKYEIPE